MVQSGKNPFSEMFKGTLPQICAAMSGTCSAISDGMQYGWSAPFIPRFQEEDSPVKITEDDVTWLETVYLIGGICGLPVTVYFVDKIGRQKSLIIAATNSLIGWILIAFANRVEYLYVARFLTGLAADVAFVSAPMYVAEIADQKIRGFLASIIYLMMLIGLVIVYILAPYTPIYVSSIVGSIVLIFQLSTFPFMPESPYYLLSKGKTEQARKALTFLRKGCDIEKLINDLSRSVEKHKNDSWRPQDLLLVKTNRKSLFIVGFLNAAQHFSGYSVMLMNLHIILESAGSIYMDSKIAAITFAVIMTIAAAFSSFVVDRFGRKFLLISSSILSSFALFLLAIYFNLKEDGYNVLSVSWIPIVSVMIYAACFKLGLGIVPIVLTAEIFPTDVKALGMTTADFMFVAFATLSIYFYQYLSKPFGIHVPFYIFASITLFSAVVVCLFVPETKGRTLEEIQLILKGEFNPDHIKNALEGTVNSSFDVDQVENSGKRNADNDSTYNGNSMKSFKAENEHENVNYSYEIQNVERM